jgi:hypothetical protein
MSSVVLAEVHWAAMAAAIGIATVETLSILCDVRVGARPLTLKSPLGRRASPVQHRP